MKPQWITLVLLVFMTWACSDDDNTPGIESKTLAIQVSEKSLLLGERMWILVSDSNGKLLGSKQLTNGETYTFLAPAGFSEDVITYTTLLRSEDQHSSDRIEMYIVTHAGVPFGAYTTWFPPVFEGAPSEDRNSSQVSVAGSLIKGWEIAKMICLPYDRNVDASTVTTIPEDDRCTFNVSATGNSAVLLADRTTPPFYYHYLEIEPDKNYIVSANDFTEADIKTIEIPETDNFSCQIIGSNTYGSFSYYYDKKESGTPIDKIIAPAYGNVFSSYQTLLNIIVTDKKLISCSIYDVDIPTSAELIDPTIGVTYQDGTIITEHVISEDPDVDMMKLTAISGNHSLFAWRIYAAPNARRITPPRIPDFIALAPGETARTFTEIAEHNIMTYTLQESSDHQGYYDFLTRYELNGQNPMPKKYVTSQLTQRN
ncbi:hypothetical protein KK062_18270 [Fulvivirgaceae bacterium PWU5]|uniref:Uncharacterized protein n=1 Tax=Dawidia cretensis TaxID=2782350 RepID=A0AAP2DZE2_9BACT|nr:hypothetical protein [Dawidia cretensis]MBT1710198.1 hypothetical protein [Dawidia cretensis]